MDVPQKIFPFKKCLHCNIYKVCQNFFLLNKYNHKYIPWNLFDKEDSFHTSHTKNSILAKKNTSSKKKRFVGTIGNLFESLSLRWKTNLDNLSGISTRKLQKNGWIGTMGNYMLFLGTEVLFSVSKAEQLYLCRKLCGNS